MDFDSVRVNESTERSFTIANQGRDTLRVSEITVDYASFSGDFAEFILEPYTSRDIAVTFAPDAANVFEGTLTIVSNDPEREVCTISLHGVGVALGVGDEDNLTPAQFYLSQAHPNPFNSTTIITYGLPFTAPVSIAMYDISGRLVATLIDGQQGAGSYNYTFNADGLSAGIYIIRMEAGSFSAIRKVVLVK